MGSIFPPGAHVAPAPFIHVSFRDHIGLDDPDPAARLLARKIGGRFFHVLFRHALGDFAHAVARVRPQALLKIVELRHHVIGGQAGEIGRFRMSASRGKVARRAAGCGLPLPAGDNLWERHVLVGIPVRRMVDIVDLPLCVRF